MYPLELIGNKRGSRPGDEDVNLDNICCSLRGSTPDDEEGNETKDLHDNDTHGPRPPKVDSYRVAEIQNLLLSMKQLMLEERNLVNELLLLIQYGGIDWLVRKIK